MTDRITSKDNRLVKDIHKLMLSAKTRKLQKCFVTEGLRLCRDAALSGAEIKYFLYTQAAEKNSPQDISFIAERSDKCYEVSDDVFEKITDTRTPQGLLCVVKMNDKQIMESLEKGFRYIGLEKIQDPSNLGTILRTAEALGADGVIMSSDCCDIYSPKVVRGSMGAVFRLPYMIVDDMPAKIGQWRKEGFDSYGSTPKNAESLNDIDFSAGGIMLIGNEANGLSDDTLGICSRRVMIPMKGRAESLNASAAAAILMYRFVC